MADAARNVAQKKHAADQMCQSEQQHVDDLENFNRVYLIPLSQWVNEPANADVFAKHPGVCSKAALDSLFFHSRDMAKVHYELCRDLKER